MKLITKKEYDELMEFCRKFQLELDEFEYILEQHGRNIVGIRRIGDGYGNITNWNKN